MRLHTIRKSPAATSRQVLVAALLAASLAPAAGASEQEEVARAQVQAAADGIRDALASVQAIPGAFPAVSAVVVQGEATPLLFVQGTARAGDPRQVDHRS